MMRILDFQANCPMVFSDSCVIPGFKKQSIGLDITVWQKVLLLTRLHNVFPKCEMLGAFVE